MTAEADVSSKTVEPSPPQAAGLGEQSRLGTASGATHPAAKVSMVCANFKNAEAFEQVLLDWFEFLGGRPGEVVVVDGGSDRRTHELYFDLLGRGLIDKLQLIRPEHEDNSRETCFIQETQVAAFASKPYLLFWKSDTLPFRRGHDGWLAEALERIERDDTFAVGGSFNIPSKHHDAWPGHYFADRCSENFSLMKRERFIGAVEEFAGAFVGAGFRGVNPGEATGQQRYLVEVAFEQYMRRHGLYTLCRVEDETWTVYHTNAAGERLVGLREKYRRREDVARYFNAGECVALHGGSYYGRRRSVVAEARAAIGRWRRIALHRLTGRPTGLPESRYRQEGVRAEVSVPAERSSGGVMS